MFLAWWANNINVVLFLEIEQEITWNKMNPNVSVDLKVMSYCGTIL